MKDLNCRSYKRVIVSLVLALSHQPFFQKTEAMFCRVIGPYAINNVD